MRVVSDASVLISLAAIGNLEILRELYAAVSIPETVDAEVTTALPHAVGAAETKAAEWIRVAPVRSRELVQALSVEIDSGEAEAIALAVETKADLLLMDERRGRKAAERLDLPVVGVLGVLLEAKRKGHIPAMKPVLEALILEAGFRVGGDLVTRVLDAAGESESE